MRLRRVLLVSSALAGVVVSWRTGWLVPSRAIQTDASMAVAVPVTATIPLDAKHALPPSPGSPESRGLIRGWAEALKLIQAEADASRRDEMIEALLGRMASSDFPPALSFLEEHHAGPLADALERRLIRHWAE